MRQSLFFLGTILGCRLLLPIASFAQPKKPVVPAKKAVVAVKKPVASVVPVTQVAAPIKPTFLDDEAEESFNLSFALKKSTANQSLVFDYQDEKNYYLLEIDGTKPNVTTAKFSVVQNGLRKLLSAAPVALDAQNNLVLQRRPWTMQLIVKDKIALRAFDPNWSEGKIGYVGANFTDLRVQPTEKVRFDDDFTRAGQGGDNDWKTQIGKWTLSASSEHVNSRNANMSSNPFAFEATSPKGEAFTTGGRWFWDSYDARVSVRPFGKGEVGIAAYVKDAKNYLAFKWSSTDSSAARRIVQVTNGVETVLASGKGAYFSRQWYEIGLRLSPGYVEALLDGVPVLRAPSESLGQGGVGLWAKDIENAAFDDVRVRSYDFLRPQFAQNGAWQIQNGSWKFGGPQADIAGNGIVTIGPKQNQNYRALISMPLNGTGLITGWQDSKNYTLFRVLNGRAQIVRTENGQNTLLSDTPQKIITARDGSTRFLLETTDGVLTVSNNDKIVAQSAGPKLTNGKFGLLSNAKSTNPVSFKDPVLFFPPPPEPLKVAERMENDPYMIGWASPSGEWPVTPAATGLEFWNAGEHFGDVTLQFPWRKTWIGTFEVALRAKRGDFNSGLILRGKKSETGDNVDWQLLQGEKVLAQSSVKFADLPNLDSLEGATLEVALKGAGLVLSSSNGPILSYLGADSVAGTGLAVRSQGFRVRTERLLTTTANRDDYTFTGAPTDFYSLSGQWNIFSRWPCYGDWSFFGGEGQNPVLWTKRQYSGDVVAEFYAHPQMILPKEPGYSHPGDLNVSIGGDGKNPASGYSFVIAGWDNTRSALFRGNKLVADNSNSQSFFANTINHDMRWHRRWINIRAEVRNAVKDGKNGALVTLTLEDAKILEWFDEKPLESWKNGGRVAFWTVDSTMMIARAKIEAQNMGVKALPAGLIDTRLTSPPVVPSSETIGPRNIAGESSLSAVITRNANSWTVKNPIAGGVFSVGLNAPTSAITRDSQFAFDARIPEDVKIDLYAKVDGAWYTFEVSGGQKNDPMAPTIGKANVSAVADSTAKHYSFDVGAAFAKEFPDQKSWNIDEVRLGAMQGNAYRWIGFDGNDFGDSYEIDGFQWR